jgi:hypothetical protein
MLMKRKERTMEREGNGMRNFTPLINFILLTSLSFVCSVWKSLNFLVTTHPSDTAPSTFSGMFSAGVTTGGSSCEQCTTMI